MSEVSVIIPAYNAEKYINETLQSVLNQDFKSFEVIVVNDGSSDKTLEKLSQYGSQITVFSQGNCGPGSARNTGILKSKGKYIAFLDADDLWQPNKLSIQVEYMEQNNSVGYSYTNAKAFSTSKNGLKTIKRDFVCDIQGFVFKDQFWSNFVINSTVMVRTKYFKQVGLFDESKWLVGVEDYEMWLRLNRVVKLGAIQDFLVEYRLRENSLIGDSYEKAFPKHVGIYKKFYRSFPDTKERIDMTENQALGDLFIRYSYKNFISRRYMLALKKSLRSIFFTPRNGLLASLYILFKKSNLDLWRPIIPKFDLWHKITSAKW